jgi:hypothetical protein
MGGGLRGRWRDGNVGKVPFPGLPGWQGKVFSAKHQAGRRKEAVCQMKTPWRVLNARRFNIDAWRYGVYTTFPKGEKEQRDVED